MPVQSGELLVEELVPQLHLGCVVSLFHGGDRFYV